MVGPRFRRDMGDIEGLAASIRDLGLLQPIVITSPPANSWPGHRRLLACRLLGLGRKNPGFPSGRTPKSWILNCSPPCRSRCAARSRKTSPARTPRRSELAEIQRVVIEHWSAARKANQGKRTDLTSTQVAVEVPAKAATGGPRQQVARLFGESEHTDSQAAGQLSMPAEAEPERFARLRRRHGPHRPRRSRGSRASATDPAGRAGFAPSHRRCRPDLVGASAAGDPPWPYRRPRR